MTDGMRFTKSMYNELLKMCLLNFRELKRVIAVCLVLLITILQRWKTMGAIWAFWGLSHRLPNICLAIYMSLAVVWHFSVHSC